MKRALALPALGLGLLACTRAAPAIVADAPLEIVVPTAPATLDPRFATDAVAVRATRLVHAGLVRLDPRTLAPVPYAARALRDLGPLALEVELRDDVRFHGGKALAPDDVCATLAALADPALGSPHRAVVRDLARCEPTGARTLRLTWARPRASRRADLELPILRADEAHAPPRPRGDLDGLGPWAIARASEGSLELAPVDGSPLPRPAHALVLRTVHDENARALRLLAGRADVAPNALSPTLLPALDGRAGLTVRSARAASVTDLLADNERAPLDRVEVRRALAQAIDREQIVRTLLAGRAEVATGFFPPGSMAHPPSLELLAPRHDREAARRVLGALGGARLTLLTSTERLRVTLARLLAQQLADAGLEVEVVPLDFGVLLARLAAGDYDLATLTAPELTEPNVLKWFFHSGAIPTRERPAAGANRSRHRDGELDGWLDAAEIELDLGARTALYGQVAERLARDLPVVPLWHEQQVAVVSRRAAAFEPSADGRWLGLASVP